ncbi:hypothetical protein [Pigmentibacter ruber]|uniref:hypothetical protein n=1 Tax=Pigmentibacter ruber TaxID=2683196 RepID=UPI00131B8116|nr:hypothetical protein [Pigmentibacter ruber]
MSRKQAIIIFSIISLLAFLSFYITRKRDDGHFAREPLKANDILALEEKNKSTEKQVEEKKLITNDSSENIKKDENKKIDTKDLSPKEYVAWLKDTQDRVLLEVKPDGTKIYRKGNVTITVMRNGEELYLPDEM